MTNEAAGLQCVLITPVRACGFDRPALLAYHQCVHRTRAGSAALFSGETRHAPQYTGS